MQKKKVILGFDISPVLGNKTGVEYYSLRLYEALKNTAGENQIVAFSKHPVPEVPEAIVVPSGMPLSLWRQLVLPRWLKKYGVTSLHSPVTAVPWLSLCPSVATVHDVSYRFAPGYSRKSRISQIVNCTLAVHACKKIVAVSTTTCQQLQKYYPLFKTKFNPVRSGAMANPPVFHNDNEILLTVKPPYFVQLGRIEHRKDPMTTLNAFKGSKLYERYSLVFVGSPGNAMNSVQEWMKYNPEVAQKIIITGYLPENDVHSLLRNADALLYPSVDEGFGHPPFEALSVKTLPLVSDIAVFRELLQDAALYAPCGDVTAFAEQLKNIASDSIDKTTVFSAADKRFQELGWQKTAREIWDLHAGIVQ